MPKREIYFQETENDHCTIRLQKAVAKAAIEHIDQKIATETNETEIRCMQYAKKALCDNTIGEWYFVQVVQNDIPLPVFGALCSFHYEGDTYMYSWDFGRHKIGLYYCPDELHYIYKDFYIFMSDLEDENNFREKKPLL